MKFCLCKHYVATENNDDICECGHDIDDHVHQVIGGCEERLD